MELDSAGWSGEGAFTQDLIERLRAVDSVAAIKVEDAPATRSEADYNFIANEIFVTFAMSERQEPTRHFGFIPGRKRVAEKALTLAGLAGLGDLVLTCTGALSRNRTVGLELARGRSLAEIVGGMKMIAEGIETTRATVDLARRQSVEMPIAEQMLAMLHLGRRPEEAVRLLMDRSLKSE